MPCLYIIVPCFNEEEVLPKTSKMFLEKLTTLIADGKVSDDSKILFVNDGSNDKTWDIVKNLAQEDYHFLGISQSRNRGHQSSLLAGLMEAKEKCDVTISIDCDGQDDLDTIDEMLDKYNNGYEVVYGVRKKRDTDTFFKRFCAESFYKFMRLMGSEVVYNHADYRLISSKVLTELAKFGEVNLFMRGIVPLVGYKSCEVYYDRKERLAGKTKYSLKKMISLAFDGITSLSIRPIRIISAMGVLFSFVSFIGIIWSVVEWFLGNTVIGWGSLVCIICFMSGINLLCLGVIGEYLGKIYLETKKRPRYIISEKTYEE